MPKQKRYPTKYQGVFFITGTSPATGKSERIYYIRYKRKGKRIEEKAGRQYQDGMTQARAARIRAKKIDGDKPSNVDKRKQAKAQASQWTFDMLWESYKETKPDLKGIVQDENRYQKHVQPAFGEREPKTLIPLDIDRLRINLLKTLKPQSAKHVLALVRRLINFGESKQICKGPDFAIAMPPVDNLKTEDLSPEQIQKLMKVLDESTNIQVANLMKMALFTGMRRGELFNLEWEDIDFNQGFILIREPKGGTSQRIPLNVDARSLLDGHPRSDSPYVFPGEDGGPRKEVKRAANKIKKAAGLPENFRAIHGLRHVYASLLASSGKVDLYTIQKLLTHKSPQVTQRYAHLRDEALRKASDLAGDLLRQQVNKGNKILSLKQNGQATKVAPASS